METATALQIVRNEIDRATKEFPSFRSEHEAIAIIEEEFLELRTAIFTKIVDRTDDNFIKEATHLAAMATRFLIDLE